MIKDKSDYSIFLAKVFLIFHIGKWQTHGIRCRWATTASPATPNFDEHIEGGKRVVEYAQERFRNSWQWGKLLLKKAYFSKQLADSGFSGF